MDCSYAVQSWKTLWQGDNHPHGTHARRLCYYFSLAPHNPRLPLASLVVNHHTQYLTNSFTGNTRHLWPGLFHPDRLIVKPRCAAIPLALSNVYFSDATPSKGTPVESGVNHLEDNTSTFSYQVL